MAKHGKQSAPTVPPEEDRRRWQAEQIVRDSMEKAPGYRKQVNKVMRELKRIEKSAAKNLGKK
ncbi:MAG: hypothetical protein ACE5JS_21585 [Nitrospinota bacterium]